ncbi:hypothetical protein GEMRC1_013488 [Eukaryota sp. GEM-RC1]
MELDSQDLATLISFLKFCPFSEVYLLRSLIVHCLNVDVGDSIKIANHFIKFSKIDRISNVPKLIADFDWNSLQFFYSGLTSDFPVTYLRFLNEIESIPEVSDSVHNQFKLSKILKFLEKLVDNPQYEQEFLTIISKLSNNFSLNLEFDSLSLLVNHFVSFGDSFSSKLVSSFLFNSSFLNDVFSKLLPYLHILEDSFAQVPSFNKLTVSNVSELVKLLNSWPVGRWRAIGQHMKQFLKFQIESSSEEKKFLEFLDQ